MVQFPDFCFLTEILSSKEIYFVWLLMNSQGMKALMCYG